MTRTLIVGTRRAGQALARDLRETPRYGLRPVAVLDTLDTLDDIGENGENGENRDEGETFGDKTSPARLTHLIAEHDAGAVVLAIPELPARRFREWADAALRAGAVVRYLPWHAAALPREATGADLRSLDVRALIDGPKPHVPSPETKEIVTGKRVLVTGAGGSLGAELCRQLHAFSPGALFLLDEDAQALRSLRADVWGDGLTTDLRDHAATDDALRSLKPEVVFHAAGLRQGSFLERRPSEGVKANVQTTDNLVRAAARHGAERFILLSTDADPASMLGASYRVAEAIVLGAPFKNSEIGKGGRNRRSGKTGEKKHRVETAFTAVRVGDVLGARTSLLTVLADQIRTGGPVTVTHPHASRGFATVEEAIALTLEAARIATGGELYTLDLGEPMQITEVVARFTQQYRLPEVPIRYVSAGPSTTSKPVPVEGTPTPHPQIIAIPTRTGPAEYTQLPGRLDKLYTAAAKNRDPKVRQMLTKLAAVRPPLPTAASGA